LDNNESLELSSEEDKQLVEEVNGKVLKTAF